MKVFAILRKLLRLYHRQADKIDIFDPVYQAGIEDGEEIELSQIVPLWLSGKARILHAQSIRREGDRFYVRFIDSVGEHNIADYSPVE